MKINDISAVVLAGGKNTRIRKEKSLIEIQGIPLIDHQIKLLGNIFGNIIIVSAKPAIKNRFPDLMIVEDEFTNCGPLGGIHAAMKHSQTKSIFVFACDMPYLNESIILRQILAYQNDAVDVLVPRHIEGIEPLHAIYSVSNLPFLEKHLNLGLHSVRSFYKQVRTKYLDLEAKQIKFFYNINTSNDLLKII